MAKQEMGKNSVKLTKGTWYEKSEGYLDKFGQICAIGIISKMKKVKSESFPMERNRNFKENVKSEQLLVLEKREVL